MKFFYRTSWCERIEYTHTTGNETRFCAFAKLQMVLFFPQVRPAVRAWTNPLHYPCPTAAWSDRAAAPHVIVRGTTVTATNLSESEREKGIKTETGVTSAITAPGIRENLAYFCLYCDGMRLCTNCGRLVFIVQPEDERRLNMEHWRNSNWSKNTCPNATFSTINCSEIKPEPPRCEVAINRLSHWTTRLLACILCHRCTSCLGESARAQWFRHSDGWRSGSVQSTHKRSPWDSLPSLRHEGSLGDSGYKSNRADSFEQRQVPGVTHAGGVVFIFIHAWTLMQDLTTFIHRHNCPYLVAGYSCMIQTLGL
jgi:hypothetical protein